VVSFPAIGLTFIEEPVLILNKNGTGKTLTLMLKFPIPMQNPNPPS